MRMSVNGWARLELRYLAALRAVAAEGSFRRAAERLGYTQSAVSQQIAALEREVDERVVVRPRGRGQVTLTEAGAVLLRHADAISERVDAARADLDALRDGRRGALRVGIFQSVGARVIPHLVPRFSSAWPDVEVTLHDSSCDEVLCRRVEAGELDLAFAILPPIDGPYATLDLIADPYLLLVPAASPLADAGVPADGRALQDTPMIGCRWERRAVDELLHERGIEPSIVYRSDDNGTVLAFVATGTGIALVPQLALDGADERTRALEMDGLLAPRRIGLVWHREREPGPAALAFIELARAVCAEL
jgi:DNA-binding transcriptional LysR family regulator